VQFLRQLIGFYGGQMQGVLPSYLEMSLYAFSRQQEQMRGQLSKAFGASPGAGLMDEAVKRNMAMFAEAMKMWPGFGAATAAAFAAQVIGQSGQRRGLKGGAPVLDAARSAYLGTEYSGAAERRPKPGKAEDTDI
jgi:polyhydroxyalkanoate synthesis regulator protein